MIRPDGEFRLCCISREKTNKETVRNTTIEEWNKGPVIAKAKEQLANGVFPTACSKCEMFEKAGEESMRTRPRIYGPGVSHLDLRFSNQCNLRCVMCYPGSSSSLEIEHHELISKGLESPWAFVETDKFNWFNKERSDEITSNPDLREVYLTGGEPMMVKGLDYFISNLDPSVELRFNTNGTLFNPKLFELFKRFNHGNLNVSVDGIGKVNDYIRWGSDFTVIEENIQRWQDVAHVNLGPTVQVLNMLNLEEYIEWADKHNLEIWDNVLVNPTCLHMKNAPDALKANMKVPDYQHVIDLPADTKEFAEFKKWVNILDTNRGITIRDYVPEIADAYGM